jgi:hypothetical protein
MQDVIHPVCSFVLIVSVHSLCAVLCMDMFVQMNTAELLMVTWIEDGDPFIFGFGRELT